MMRPLAPLGQKVGGRAPPPCPPGSKAYVWLRDNCTLKVSACIFGVYLPCNDHSQGQMDLHLEILDQLQCKIVEVHETESIPMIIVGDTNTVLNQMERLNPIGGINVGHSTTEVPCFSCAVRIFSLFKYFQTSNIGVSRGGVRGS